jgi:hypothetical protein
VATFAPPGEDLENWWNRWPAVRKRVLRRGVDFDQVVLGISLGAYPYLCKQLIAEMPAFARMVDAVKVTETQAAQLWLSRDVTQLGWVLGARPIIGTCREPFDTVADMSHVLPRERPAAPGQHPVPDRAAARPPRRARRATTGAIRSTAGRACGNLDTGSGPAPASYSRREPGGAFDSSCSQSRESQRPRPARRAVLDWLCQSIEGSLRCRCPAACTRGCRRPAPAIATWSWRETGR